MVHRGFKWSFILSCLLVASALAQGDAKLPPIKELTDVKPKASVFGAASRDKPLVIRSEKEAAKHFSAEELAKLTEAADFERQFVLVFAWRGSGQDRLEYAVLESLPEQVVFKFTPGRTRDLRPHTHVYVLRSNVRWRTGATNSGQPAADAEEYIKVEVKGKLNSQVVAIGGETTGVVISASGATWELDLGKDEGLRKKAEELHEKTVIVKGKLNVKASVEIRRRWIVAVASLTEPGGSDGENPYLTADGSLRHSLILRDSQTGFAGDSGHIWTIEPDGSWRHQTFLNKDVREPEHEGKFSKRQIQALARYLAKYDLLGLPERMGKDPGVNSHMFSITFGKKQSALIGPGGASLPPADPKNPDAAEQRFAALVRLLQRGMKVADPQN